MTLTKYCSEVRAVFDLLGRSEVDLTAALGWTLSRSPNLLATLITSFGFDTAPDDIVVALEEADAAGRTDIELTGPGLKIIIEAKQGWLVPGEAQLTKYVDRLTGFEKRLLVSMSDSSALWASDQLPTAVLGVPVLHASWDEVRALVASAHPTTHTAERLWLHELENYMGRATSKVPFDDQWVFSVVVSRSHFGGITFRDYVRTERVYFHPFGGNNTWPKVAPNFLCFRWEGQVRQVNRVTSFEVLPKLSTRWPAVTSDEAPEPHIVYELGPDIPLPAISTKGTYATGRVWCLLDQLLVQPTLAEAVRSSKELAAH